MKKKRERTQINNIRNERAVTIDTTEIQRKFDNLGEMDKFLETYNLPKLNHEEAESLNRLLITSKIEAIIKKTPGTEKPCTRQLHRQILPHI